MEGIICCGTPTITSQECEHNQPIANFEWVLEALAAIPRQGPDLKSQLKEWLRENRRKKKADWDKMEAILEDANFGRSLGDGFEH